MRKLPGGRGVLIRNRSSYPSPPPLSPEGRGEVGASLRDGYGVRALLTLVALAALAGAPARAHSASDAYLTLEVAAPAEGAGAPGRASSAATVVHGQWDVALRDLDFVLGLDDDDDGNITWAELRRHQAAIARYAYAHLHVDSGGRACAINPGRQMVDDHADGSYAVLLFDVVCSGAAQRITLDYRMFFAIDPSHRAIVVLRSGPAAATAVLSPQNARIELALQP